MMKQCTGCLRILPLDFFWRHKGNLDGHSYKCKECANTTHPKIRQQLREKAELFTNGLKRCTKCNKIKPFDKFHRSRRNRDGRVPQCRECLSPIGVARERLEAQGLKTCSRCNTIKAIEEFATRITGRPASECKACTRIRRQKYYRKTKARHKENSQRWWDSHPKKKRQYFENYRAKKQQAPGQFSSEDIADLWDTQDGMCVYCQKVLTDGYHGYHIDHMIPISRAGSNYPSNLQLLCRSCNSSKHDKTHEEFLVCLNSV